MGDSGKKENPRLIEAGVWKKSKNFQRRSIQPRFDRLERFANVGGVFQSGHRLGLFPTGGLSLFLALRGFARGANSVKRGQVVEFRQSHAARCAKNKFRFLQNIDRCAGNAWNKDFGRGGGFSRQFFNAIF
ncbi:hypothetical protein [Geitlerinema calcuttense]|uniref:Uncharacterized protein n=1 Tax=Geitlerinema calcuttense NRMC-F 0142 TaxID=2922238 RepID=A0ABT7M2G6_9CYAN|nr:MULTISPECIES: hypothetical protein [Cyanophyceae]MDL5055608.1 hypothetical protein [Oscillatoria laete-virens NRMC-F 0139]MDL5057825.1 hypothetical protein [Geitlerinema calcuttense NRMC-F 0142]